MKVLFYRYGSICEPDVIEQFHALGLEVDTLDIEITRKSVLPSERVSLISEKLSSDKYLFVFSINFFPSVSDTCNIFKIPYVGWVVDSPVFELFTKSIQNPCNRIFTFDRKQYEDLTRYNPSGIYHLPLGTNVNRWNEVINSITDKDVQKYGGDISFVGSLYTEKDPYLEISDPSDYLKGFTEGLFQFQKQIQGYNLIEKSLTPGIVSELKKKVPSAFAQNEQMVCNMDNYCAAHGILDMHCSSMERVENLCTLAEHFDVNLFTRSDTSVFKNYPRLHAKGGVSTLTEMPKVFNLSKINLNMTIHSIEKGASLRVWDICGCGGFLLSNYQEEIAEYLVAGEDYDFYTDLGDLVEKCRFYLENDDIRKRIALSGYEKVRKYHTYANRMPAMFKMII